jgi:hypothetical protein
MGLAVAYTRISDTARALDRDFELVDNIARPIRSVETLVTVAYWAEIKKGWTVIPTLNTSSSGRWLDRRERGAGRQCYRHWARTVVKFPWSAQDRRQMANRRAEHRCTRRPETLSRFRSTRNLVTPEPTPKPLGHPAAIKACPISTPKPMARNRPVNISPSAHQRQTTRRSVGIVQERKLPARSNADGGTWLYMTSSLRIGGREKGNDALDNGSRAVGRRHANE